MRRNLFSVRSAILPCANPRCANPRLAMSECPTPHSALQHSALRRALRPAIVGIAVTLFCVASMPTLTQAQAATPAISATAPQSVSEEIAAGDKATVARQPAQALLHYEAALQLDPRNYEALWNASRASVDLGEGETDAKKREALYAKGTMYARKSVDVNADGAEGNFAMARALGRTALTVGPRERVKFGTEVRMRALKALSADPRHAGALHVMGAWNAEIMRLNSFTRLFAKTFLGGQVFSSASWAEAEKFLTASIAVDPTRAVHRLDLARVYRDTNRPTEARAAYEAAIKCQLVDANDEMYKKQAADELRALK